MVGDDPTWTLADALDAGEQGWALLPDERGGHSIAVSEVSSLLNDDDEAALYVERLADLGDPLAMKAWRLVQSTSAR